MHQRTRQILCAEQGMRELVLANLAGDALRAKRCLMIALELAQQWQQLEDGRMKSHKGENV